MFAFSLLFFFDMWFFFFWVKPLTKSCEKCTLPYSQLQLGIFPFVLRSLSPRICLIYINKFLFCNYSIPEVWIFEQKLLCLGRGAQTFVWVWMFSSLGDVSAQHPAVTIWVHCHTSRAEGHLICAIDFLIGSAHYFGKLEHAVCRKVFSDVCLS